MELKDWFLYNKETGDIFWKQDRGRKIKAGTLITGIDKDGYLRAKLDGISYKAHRLAWYLHYGQWPINEIDHINRNRADNRIENLRDVNRRANGQNTSKFSGGVAKKYNGYQAQTSINGKRIYIGFGTTYEEAKQKYDDFIRSQD